LGYVSAKISDCHLCCLSTLALGILSAHLVKVMCLLFDMCHLAQFGRKTLLARLTLKVDLGLFLNVLAA
jgi:hypothetical protein